MLLTLLTTLLLSHPGAAAARIVVPAPYAPEDVVKALRTQTPIEQRYFDAERMLISGDLEVDMGDAVGEAMARARAVLRGDLVAGLRIQLASGTRARVFNRLGRVQDPAPSSLDWVGENMLIMGSRDLADQLRGTLSSGFDVQRVPSTEAMMKELREMLDVPLPEMPKEIFLTVNGTPLKLDRFFIAASNDESLAKWAAEWPSPSCEAPLAKDKGAADRP